MSKPPRKHSIMLGKLNIYLGFSFPTGETVCLGEHFGSRAELSLERNKMIKLKLLPLVF